MITFYIYTTIIDIDIIDIIVIYTQRQRQWRRQANCSSRAIDSAHRPTSAQHVSPPSPSPANATTRDPGGSSPLRRSSTRPVPWLYVETRRAPANSTSEDDDDDDDGDGGGTQFASCCRVVRNVLVTLRRYRRRHRGRIAHTCCCVPYTCRYLSGVSFSRPFHCSRATPVLPGRSDNRVKDVFLSPDRRRTRSVTFARLKTQSSVR